MKKRTLNEYRQTKEYQSETPEPKDDIEATKALIINTLQDDMFDMIFQAVNEEN